MRLWIWIVSAGLLLVAAGSVLLHSNQAALVAATRPVPPPRATVRDELASRAAAPAGPAVPKLSAEEFRAMGDTVLKSLPAKESLRGLKVADAFEAPLPILTAARELNRLVEAVHREPGLTNGAIALYRECTASGEYPDSVRALCLHHYRRLARQSGRPSPEGFAPGFIRELAEKLGT